MGSNRITIMIVGWNGKCRKSKGKPRKHMDGGVRGSTKQRLQRSGCRGQRIVAEQHFFWLNDAYCIV